MQGEGGNETIKKTKKSPNLLHTKYEGAGQQK